MLRFLTIPKHATENRLRVQWYIDDYHQLYNLKV